MLKLRWETEFKKTEMGEIPRDWEKSEIGSFMVIRSGKRPKEVKVYGFYEVWGANGFMGYTDDTDHLENREVLITGRVGTLGNVYYIKKNSNVWLSDNVLILYPNDQEINLKFVFYHLLTRKEDIINLDVGSTQPLITQNGLKNLIIPLPPLPEQSRIATVLSWFDDLIENKKRQNEILEKSAMAIFKNWFVDFEPFRACPEQERGNYEFVYNEELGREIPKGWEVSKTTRLIEYNHFFSLKKSEAYAFIEMKDVSSNSLVCEYNFKQFSGSGVKYYGGDTLMARITPSLEHGKTAFVWFISEKEKGFGSTEFFVLHPKEPYLKEFVYLLAKNDDFREAAINSMSGTSGRQRADINALKNYIIPIPPPPILQSFHSLVEPLFQKIILNQKQIMTLRKIKDTLLPLLVFGKLRVEEI